MAGRGRKKGVSEIVAVVLIILLTVLCAILVWGFFTGKLDIFHSASFGDVRLMVVTSGGFTVWDSESSLLAVQIERGSDKAEIDRIQIGVSVEGNSKNYFVPAPGPLESKIYYLGEVYSKPDKIHIAGLYMPDGGSVKLVAESDCRDISEGVLNPDEIIASGKWIYLTNGKTRGYDCISEGELAVEGSVCLKYQNEGHCDSKGFCHRNWDCVEPLDCFRGYLCEEMFCENYVCSYEKIEGCEEEAGVCGDGLVGLGEYCDKNYFGDWTCALIAAEQGKDSPESYDGVLKCVDDCQTVDPADCRPFCNNDGVKDDWEVCDGNDFGIDGSSCEGIMDYNAGTLLCTGDCEADFSNCESYELDEIDFFFGSDGSSTEPYMIYNCYQLQNMKYDLDAHYEIKRDIDCSMTNPSDSDFDEDGLWKNEKGFLPVGCGDSTYCGTEEGHEQNQFFTGSIDGGGHEISGLFIDRRGQNDIGVVGHLSGGKIENLGMVDSDITGRAYTGGIVGTISEGATVENSYNDGTVKVVGGEGFVGGVVGYSVPGDFLSEILSCHNLGDVSGNKYVGGIIGNSGSPVINSYNLGFVSSQGYHTGGIAGYSTSSIINSYNLGFVTSQNLYTGGIAGYSTSSIINSYNAGPVSSSALDIGGIVGKKTGGVVSSYYLDNSCTQSSCDRYGGDKNESEMKTQSTYEGWDFEDVWGIQSGVNGGYPFLRN